MNAQLKNAPAQSSDILCLGGFKLLRTTTPQLNHTLAQALHNKDQRVLFFANTNFIVQCQPLKKPLAAHDILIVNDGVGVDIATWLVHRKRFPENLNGTDFTPQFLHQIRDTGRVFLLGGKPRIAQRAADTLHKEYGVTVVGTRDGYEQAKDPEQVIAAINDSEANVVLVAMGNPAQEAWIMHHRHRLNARIFVGVGALLDFLAGDKPRAPKLVQHLRLEWFYRLCLEPARLLRRYTLDIAIFLTLCLREGKKSVATPPEPASLQ